ncbi:MAG: type VI secretion system amidase effector protein Tae4 [Pirellulales bacterium]|nr:type VI secretion system amidase effector protein Tae4 [Pirellulales bacterium]
MTMWNHFSTVNVDVVGVGKVIGGKVGVNVELGVKDPQAGFTNACAIRMSYCLNNSGKPVSRGAWATVSGADKKWYIYRVKDLVAYLTHNFGKPDQVTKNPKSADFAGQKGILAFQVSGWSDATGHVTLWDGSICSDQCFFGKASEASLWTLK